MSGQPEKVAEQLFEKLHQLSIEPSKVSPFVLTQIKNEAKKLITSDAAAAYTALGCVAYFEHKTEDMLKHHKNSIRLSPSDYHVNVNYAVSLENTGRYGEAAERSIAALDFIGQDDVAILRQASEHAFSAGLFRFADEYNKQLSKLKKTPVHTSSVSFGCDLIDIYDFNEKDVKAYFCAPTTVLTRNDVYPKGESNWEIDSDIKQFVREIFIDVVPEKVAAMNVELSKEVIKLRLPPELLSVFSCSFSAGDLPTGDVVNYGD
jgi:tetratricopeptide (TPR) repeat protein